MKIRKKAYQRMMWITAAIAIFVSISFIDKRETGYRMGDIEVAIENRYENFFVDETDVIGLMMKNKGDSILGDQFGRVNLKELEDRVESHSFVKEAEVFRDLNGHLVVKAYQSKPIARLMANNGKSAYVSEEGNILPVSTKYTARVVVLSGAYINDLVKQKNVFEKVYHQELYNLVNYIRADDFWKRQIAEITIDKKGEVVMYPQIGKQQLEFGKADGFEKKFKKLKVFFKEIMPTKGWNTYKRVNVAFKDQIICE